MSRSHRVDFRLNTELDKDIIEFMAKDSRTNVGLFRDAVRLLMKVESGEQPLDAAAMIELIKETVNEEMIGGVIRNVLNDYQIAQVQPKEKTKKRLGFNSVKV